MSNFIVADRKTDYLLPPSIDDWLNEDHLARYIVEVVDQLDLSRLTRQYAGRGSKAHHPATLLSILIYGYCTGVFSSRKLERATYDSVAIRYLAAGTHPDHDTLVTLAARISTMALRHVFWFALGLGAASFGVWGIMPVLAVRAGGGQFRDEGRAQNAAYPEVGAGRWRQAGAGRRDRLRHRRGDYRRADADRCRWPRSPPPRSPRIRR